MKSRLKDVFFNKSINGFNDKQLLSATQANGVVPNSSLENRVMTATKDIDRFKLVQDGDFVVSLRSFEGGLELSKCEGVISPAYTVLSPNANVDEMFFKYYFKSHGFISALNEFKKGIRDGQAIPFTQLKDVFISAPDNDTQKALGKFINSKVRIIDSQVDSLTQKLTALEEYKTALIHNAVTKGLDANGCRILDGTPAEEMKWKDSGVEWIGEIPDGWEMARNKNMFSKSESNKVGDSWKDLQLLSLSKSGIIKKDKYGSDGKLPSSFRDYQKVNSGDLVFCLFDMDETPRTIGLSQSKGMITNAYTTFRCNTNSDSLYVYYFYRFVDDFKLLRKHYSGLRKTVRPPIFLDILMTKPSLVEQKEISEYIDKIHNSLDRLSNAINKKIALLVEYKKSLINEAVSGNI